MAPIRPVFNWVAVPGARPPVVDFARSSTATYVDRAGVIRTAPAGVLRDDFDMASGQYLGKLVEEARVNSLAYGRDLTQAARWSASNMAVARNQTGADGQANAATRLSASAPAATISQALTLASAQYTLSMRMRRLTGTGPVFLSLDNGASWTDVAAQLSATAWARPWISQTLANPVAAIRLGASGDQVCVDYVQLEAGPFPTSDIETPGTSPVTRAGDLTTLTLANLKDSLGNPLFPGGEGTLYAHGGVNAVGAATQWPMLASLYSDASHYAGIFLSDPGAGDPLMANVVDTSSQASFTLRVSVAPGQQVKSALSFKTNAFSGCADGGDVATDSLGTVPVMSVLGFGVVAGTYRLNGHLRHVALWNRAMTASDLQAVTA